MFLQKPREVIVTITGANHFRNITAKPDTPDIEVIKDALCKFEMQEIGLKDFVHSVE